MHNAESRPAHRHPLPLQAPRPDHKRDKLRACPELFHGADNRHAIPQKWTNEQANGIPSKIVFPEAQRELHQGPMTQQVCDQRHQVPQAKKQRKGQSAVQSDSIGAPEDQVSVDLTWRSVAWLR